jgi:hypothetical protein
MRLIPVRRGLGRARFSEKLAEFTHIGPHDVSIQAGKWFGSFISCLDEIKYRPTDILRGTRPTQREQAGQRRLLGLTAMRQREQLATLPVIDGMVTA